jgi:hypothetical protein
MDRGQYVAALAVVAIAGLLGGMLANSMIGQPALAQVVAKPMDPPKPEIALDRHALREMLDAVFLELAPDGSLTGAFGSIVNVLYDTETGRFGAVLKRHQKESILLLTDDPAMIATLGLALTNERLINVEVQPVDPGPGKDLMDAYQVLFVVTD